MVNETSVFEPLTVVKGPQRQETYLQTRASSEDSDKPSNLHSLIRIFTERILPRVQNFFIRTTKILIRHRGWSGWFEYFWPISLKKEGFLTLQPIFCGYSLEQPHWSGSNGYLLHSAFFRKDKIYYGLKEKRMQGLDKPCILMQIWSKSDEK